MIHRAPFGSMERFVAILIEHFAGNFPFWIAPVQATVIPIGENQNEYAQSIKDKLDALDFRVDIDLRSEKVNRKIAESEQKKIPFALILGQKEAENGTVSVRKHMKGDLGAKTLDEIIDIFTKVNIPGASEDEL
jgi:threonyl-tRNA synthetase